MARTSSKIVKKIPDSETGHTVTCTNKSGHQYLITENPLKAQFTLWEILEDGYEKISTSDNPLKFDKIVFK